MRGLLSLVAALTLVASASGANARTDTSAARVEGGVAVGDVTATAAVVWGRANTPSTMHVELVLGRRVVRRGQARATRASDDTAQVRFRRLTPRRLYVYRVWFGPARTRIVRGSFRTWPAARSRPRPLKLVLGADVGGQTRCRDAAVGGYGIFREISRVHPDALIANGDFVYVDGTCPASGAQWQNIPGTFANVLDVDWTDVGATREAVVGHWRYNRVDPFQQALLRTTPVYAQWDDHEVVNDFGAQWTYWNRDTRNRAGFPNLVAAGRDSFFDYWPITRIRETAAGIPGRHGRDRIYRSFRLGRDAALFLLDARSYRARNDVEDTGAAKPLLGAAQVRWLADSLARSTATWKLVSTDVPLFIPTCNAFGCDAFANAGTATGFERELRSLLTQLDARRVRNVVFLTTDVHYPRMLRAAVDANGDGRPLVVHQLVAGPLSAIALPVGVLDADVAGLPVQVESLYAEGGILNFGVVSVSGRNLVADVRGADGAVRPGSRLALSAR
jgi:alkaline phosphatase D